MEQESVDDGITTGWICVNMGLVDVDIPVEQNGVNTPGAVVDQAEAKNAVEEEEEEYQNPAEEDVYVGFGSQNTAPRIVVQMFTEEKRVDMDLEGLWAGRNTRRARQAQRAHAAFESSVVEDEAEFETTPSEGYTPEQQVKRDEIEKSWIESTTPLADEAIDSQRREHLDESPPLTKMGSSQGSV